MARSLQVFFSVLKIPSNLKPCKHTLVCYLLNPKIQNFKTLSHSSIKQPQITHKEPKYWSQPQNSNPNFNFSPLFHPHYCYSFSLQKPYIPNCFLALFTTNPNPSSSKSQLSKSNESDLLLLPLSLNLDSFHENNRIIPLNYKALGNISSLYVLMHQLKHMNTNQDAKTIMKNTFYSLKLANKKKSDLYMFHA